MLDFLLVLLTAVVTAIWGQDSDVAPPSDGPAEVRSIGCGEGGAQASGARVLLSGGIERSYRIYIPESYQDDKPSPLVLNLHGLGSNAAEQERYADLIDDSERAGFVLITPEGTGQLRHWSVLGPLPPGYVDDVTFVKSLLDHVLQTLCVNPERIYAVGISNGGAMASLLVCTLQDRFAAVAFVAGTAYAGPCPSSPPIPVLVFHGTSDFVVPFEGGPLDIVPSISEVVDRWAVHNKCAAPAVTTPVSNDVKLHSFSGCQQEVEFYVIEGGGHTWPGTSSPKPFLGHTTQTIDASAIIWDFFERH